VNLHTTPPATEVVSGVAIIGTWVSSFFGYLPIAAAIVVSLAGTIYYILVISTHPEVRRWLSHRRERKIIRLKGRLLVQQLAMVRSAGGADRVFWETVATESTRVLDELKVHAAAADGALRQREQMVDSKERVLARKEAKLNEILNPPT